MGSHLWLATILLVLLQKESSEVFAENFCHRLRTFALKGKDERLRGHVITEHQVTSDIECGHHCVLRAKCVSFNFRENAGVRAAHVCELNNGTVTRSPNDLVARRRFKYFEIQPQILSCSSEPCQNGAVCEQECDGQYRCICSVGYTGMHCENSSSSNEITCADTPCKNRGICHRKPIGYECACRGGFNGINCENAEHCRAIKSIGHNSSGVYNITLPNSGLISVFCEQEIGTGGWIVIQRRLDPYQLQFDRDWVDYEIGFGDLTGEFWLGNRIIHELTNAPSVQMRVVLRSSNGKRRIAEYSEFSVQGQTTDYQVTIKGYSGGIGNCGTPSNKVSFTTRDRDNDRSNQNCALVEGGGGGWWYNDCGCGNLNRQPKPKWTSWSQGDDIAYSEIMIRR